MAAGLRWEGARARRLVIGAEKRKASQASKEMAYASFSQEAIALRKIDGQYSEARRYEIAALRELAKTCRQHRGALDASDRAIIDVELIEMN